MRKLMISALLTMGLMSVVTTMNANDEVTHRLPRMHMMMQQRCDSTCKQATPEEVTARMTDALGLSKEQAKKVLELNTKYKDIIGRPMVMRGPGRHFRGERKMQQGCPLAQKDSVMRHPQRPRLTDSQKAAMKEKMVLRRTAIEAYRKELKSILTEEQLQKMEQARQKGKEARSTVKPMN